MKKVQDVFTIVKLEKFYSEYTEENARSGVYHRMKGKDTAGNPKDLTDKDKATIKGGLVKFVADLNKVIKTL